MHGASQHHLDSLNHMHELKKNRPINHILEITLRKEQQDARTSLRIIISSIRYLERSGQALRGSNNECGNLMQLLEERSLDSQELKQWLTRRDKWLSGDVQNEIIDIMSHKVIRMIVEIIKVSLFFSFMADGATDATSTEQFSTCIRIVNSTNYEIKELFLGLYSPPDTKSETLHKTLNDIFLRLTLNTNNLRGHCFDGAATMAGRLNGLQKRISEEQPKSMFVHCANHSLDLVIQEVAKNCELIEDSLNLVKTVSNAILESSKRRNIYNEIVLPPCLEETSFSQLLSLCPTRWCVRVKSMKRFYDNNATVSETLEDFLKDQSCAITSDRRAVLRGYLNKMSKFENLLALNLAISVCEPAELLAKALQHENYTASGAKQAAKSLWTKYDKMGEDEFEIGWKDCEERSNKGLDLEMPCPPKVKRPPKRFQERSTPVPIDAKTSLRRKYICVLDRIKNELNRRFEQPGMNQLVKLEKILLDPPSSYEQLEELLGVHADDFNIDTFAAELKLLPNAIQDCDTAKQFAAAFKALPNNCRRMFSETQKLISLILTVPATSTSCERSFSALRRLLTHLRGTMTQKRLTNLLLLHIHQEMTKNLDLNEIIKEFVSRTEERRKTFGI